MSESISVLIYYDAYKIEMVKFKILEKHFKLIEIEIEQYKRHVLVLDKITAALIWSYIYTNIKSISCKIASRLSGLKTSTHSTWTIESSHWDRRQGEDITKYTKTWSFLLGILHPAWAPTKMMPKITVATDCERNVSILINKKNIKIDPLLENVEAFFLFFTKL